MAIRALRLLVLAIFAGTVSAENVALPAMVLYAPSPCLACIDWAEHLRKNGFDVRMEEKPNADMPKLKRWLNVPSSLESVHTARIGPYFIEGHVPAEDIKLLLKEKPKARGLTVPGAPRGAPGLDVLAGTGCETGCTMLEGDGATKIVRREMFNTLLVGKDGKTSVFARH